MRNQIWEDKISAASRGHDLWRLDQTKLSISCVEWVVFGGHKTSAGHSRIQRSGKRAEELPERPDGPPSPSLICLRNTCWCWRCVQGSQKGDRAVEGKGVGVGRGIFEVNICLMWSRKFWAAAAWEGIKQPLKAALCLASCSAIRTLEKNTPILQLWCFIAADLTISWGHEL